MTKHELADKAHISISFLSDLTNGKANPSLKIMERSPTRLTPRCQHSSNGPTLTGTVWTLWPVGMLPAAFQKVSHG